MRKFPLLWVLADCWGSDATNREKLLTMGADGMKWLNLIELMKNSFNSREMALVSLGAIPLLAGDQAHVAGN